MSAELNRLEAQIDAEIKVLQRQKTTNMIIGVVLMLLMAGYFFFMSTKVEQVIEPQGIVTLASQRMVDYLPTARRPLEEAARREIPLQVNNLIDNLLQTTIPSAREHIKKEILAKAEGAMDEAEGILFARIEEHLKTHGEKLQSLAADLSTEDGTRAFEDAIYASMEEVVKDPSVQIDLLGYAATLNEIEMTLAYLSQNEVELTPAEDSARELVAVLRELMNRAKS